MQAATKSPEVPEVPIAELVEGHGGFAKTWRDAGLNETTLYRVMTGRRNPSYATRLKLARVFRCRVDEMTFPADTEQS